MNSKNQSPSPLSEHSQSQELTNGESKVLTVSQWFELQQLRQDKWDERDRIQYSQDNKDIGHPLFSLIHKGVQKILCGASRVLWKIR